MATNDFLVFGGGSSPNVIDQATYAALSARLSGFQSGTALSAQLNKVWRQSSIMAAVLAQFTANFSGQNSVDDGSTATLLANLQAAINAAGITAPQFDSSTKFATSAFVQRAIGNMNGYYTYSAAATMPASQLGGMIETNTAAFTLTLPSPTLANGEALCIWNNNSNAVTLSTPSGNFFGSVGSGTATFALKPQECVWLVSGGNWEVNFSTLRGRTAAQFDNSTSIATTAFVQRALGNFGSFSAFNVNTTLTASYAGQAIQWYGAAGGVITLPPGSSMPSGGALLFFNFGSGPITIATQGADFIWSARNVQPVTLQTGDSLLLVARGSTEWDVAGGTAAIQFNPLVVAPATQSSHAMQLGQATGRLLRVTTFSSSGTFTPGAGTAAVRVRIVGGGGGGGGAPATGASQVSIGSGGGGGAYSEGYFTSGFSGVTVTIGAAGSTGSGVAGGNGGTTSFGALMSAPGGSGGGVAGPSAPPFSPISAGGSAAGAGGNILTSGGGSAGIALAINVSSFAGSAGGNSVFGGGASLVANGVNGAASPSKGGGGGGTGQQPSGAALTGGAAGPGYAIIEEFGSA
ncbi:hypothetical protein ABEG10_08730 [Burkholderia cenocepacia]|uniref:glycine-rich domain-containing protein n=1 Tax=Burkholderia cenocepacia TaxID=95486 RepID=UPI00209D03B5|nr:hypothetical protein [Burkholderia cenocepacia]MCO8321984.1 hypothetical protein [Burkholderia cenocepacia]MCO8329268.1 hypothetical protein [Burkholderia cenocepacia]MCO8336611.1 hypothetical protein [Burkholderia cenocepacia]MCO8343896.1 hypothetical protein [Burkholderia cenocepacia]MCO8357121.1 hypothetical protein [Burkholderia cenocepacia]